MCSEPIDQAGEPLAGLNHPDVLTRGGACFASADAGGAGGSAGASAAATGPTTQQT